MKNLVKNIPIIHENELAQIKTKLRNSCEKYCNIKVAKHQKKFIINIMKRNNIAIIKQCKERGVVIMEKNKHREKGFTLLSTKQFQKLNFEPKKAAEEKVKHMARKIKSKLTVQKPVQKGFVAWLNYIKLF